MIDASPHISSGFSWRIRVYWEDTDAGGVVYHAAYLCFMERARSEWLRRFGVDQAALRDRGMAFVVRDMQLDFHAPARFDEELAVTVAVETLRRASMRFTQAVSRPDDDRLLVRASVRVACVDIDRMCPAPIPDDILARIS